MKKQEHFFTKTRTRIMLCFLAAELVLSGCSGTGGRQFPDTTYDGEQVVTEEDEEQIRTRLCLEEISPQAYADSDELIPEPGTRIAMIGRDASDPAWKVLQQGAQLAVAQLNEQLGYTDKDKMTIVFDAPAVDGDVEEQVSILDEILNSGDIEAICIDLIDEKACRVQFDLAADNRIPVIAMDSGRDDDSMGSLVGTDHYRVGAELAEKAIQIAGESGKVLLLNTTLGAQADRRLLQGFESTMKEKGNGIEILHIEDPADYPEHPEEDGAAVGGDSTSDGDSTDSTGAAAGSDPAATGESAAENTRSREQVIEENLETLRNCAVCVALDVYAAEVFLEMQSEEMEQKPICSMGVSSELLKKIRAGSRDVFYCENPFGIGYASILAAERSIEELSNEAVVLTGGIWIDTESVDTERAAALLYF